MIRVPIAVTGNKTRSLYSVTADIYVLKTEVAIAADDECGLHRTCIYTYDIRKPGTSEFNRFWNYEWLIQDIFVSGEINDHRFFPA